MKKVLTLVLAMLLAVGCFCFTGCKSDDSKVSAYKYTRYEIVDKQTEDVLSEGLAPVDCMFIFNNYKTPHGYFVKNVNAEKREIQAITWNYIKGDITISYNVIDNVVDVVVEKIVLQRKSNKVVTYTVENDATTNKVMYFERETLYKQASEYAFEIKRGQANTDPIIEVYDWNAWTTSATANIVTSYNNYTHETFYSATTNGAAYDKSVFNKITLKFFNDGTCYYVEGNGVGVITETKYNYTVGANTITLNAIDGGVAETKTLAYVKESKSIHPLTKEETIVPAEIRVVVEYPQLNLVAAYVLRGDKIPVNA